MHYTVFNMKTFKNAFYQSRLSVASVAPKPVNKTQVAFVGQFSVWLNEFSEERRLVSYFKFNPCLGDHSRWCNAILLARP